MYEESPHLPLIWNLPGRIRAGRSLSPMVSNYDFFPTILDYLGVPAPKGAVRRPGRRYAPFPHGEPPAWRNRLYKVAGELFDMEADPGEKQNAMTIPGKRMPTYRRKSDGVQSPYTLATFLGVQ
jgi:arylsulfatase A-like enzyme